MLFMSKFSEICAQYPDLTIVYDENSPKGMTYAQLDELSGRVYAYLKRYGIGKEDFVFIRLPRSVQAVVAVLGVVKAGAALVIGEDTMPPERVGFIQRDCRCKLEVNAENWGDILNEPSLPGYVETEPHDALFAIYTSGTTGNPKGILHEYGNLDRLLTVQGAGRRPFEEGKSSTIHIAPLYFVAGVNAFFVHLFNGCVQHILSYSTIKNAAALKAYLVEKKIITASLSPSYLRTFGKDLVSTLKSVTTGSEPANNLYIEGATLVNTYSMSESGCPLCMFIIDKPYDLCPIGKPLPGIDIKLLDEDGNEVAEGEVGEFCFDNPYVRGYINLPEQTAKVFVNGYYHTGDLARKDENGNYLILGRNNDMIKINGNRVEPAEIEAAVKEVSGLSWVVAKGFVEGSRATLCVYYTDDAELDTAALQKKLSKRLPYYMIPSFFIKLDEVPLTPSGKLSRKDLPKPDMCARSDDYAAPTNETESRLCDAFAKVLQLERVSIHDDFFQLGGDSLRSIEAVVASDLPGLGAEEVFRGRTAEKIAALYEEQHQDALSDDEENERSLKVEHRLSSEQLYMFDYQFYTPKSTMYNIYTLLRFQKAEASAPALAQALDRVIANHPALATVFYFNEDGDVVHRYRPERLQPVEIELMSEEDFAVVKNTLVRPYKLINSLMFRCRLFETESSNYVFLDIHHTLSDGTSFTLILSNILRALQHQPLEKDYYYLMLSRREKAMESKLYEQGKAYFESTYSGKDWQSYPTIDHALTDNKSADLCVELPVTCAQAPEIECKSGVSANEFFMTAAALAMSAYNHCDDILFSWIYNGRGDVQSLSSAGLYFRSLPMGFRFQDDLPIGEVFKDVQRQTEKGIEMSCYPYVNLHSEVGRSETAFFLYQVYLGVDESLDSLEMESVELRHNAAAAQSVLDMEISNGEESGALVLRLDYSASRYEKESMELFGRLFKDAVSSLLAHLGEKEVTCGELKPVL